MTKARHEHAEASDTDGHRIDGAADEIFSRAQDAVRDVADRATHLAQDTLERGRAGIHEVERTTRGGHSGRGRQGGTSAFATALAVGAMGYAIATLIQGSLRKRRGPTVRVLPDKVPPATPAA